MRSVPEWIGKTDDHNPPRSVYRRKFRAAGECCEGPCHRRLGPADKWDLDHIVRIADGGENRESNLQVLCEWCHDKKTALENSEGAKANSKFDSLHGIKQRRKPGHFARLRAWRDQILAQRTEPVGE